MAGAAVEATVLAMLNMSVLIHDRLPADHDPLWDDLLQLHQRFGSRPWPRTGQEP